MTACFHDFRVKLNRLAHRYLPLAMLATMFASHVAAADSGVVVMYHRIGDEVKFPSTSVSKEQFEAHI